MGSTPENGSSRSSKRGLVMRDRAISRRRFSPPESTVARLYASRVSPNSASNSSLRRARSRRDSGVIWRIASRLSSTVSPRNTLDS